MISPTSADVDSSNRELLRHGTTAFPIACYYDDLNDYCFPWHWHEELEAAVVTAGEPLVTIGSRSYHIRTGDGFFVNTGVLHSGQVVRQEDRYVLQPADAEGPADAASQRAAEGPPNAASQKGAEGPADAAAVCGPEESAPGAAPGTGQCRLHSVVFHERLVGGSRESVFYQRYVQPLTGNTAFEGCMLSTCIPWQAKALTQIERAYHACRNEPEDYELTVRSALSELLALLVRNIPAQQTPPDAGTLREAERIKRMLQFIEMHYAEELTTADIAQSASVSESECLRCFHAAIGTTPIRYLREYRIERASALLASGAVRPSEAAAACGFQDMSYFDRTFRQLRGCTPGAYARRRLEEMN